MASSENRGRIRIDQDVRNLATLSTNNSSGWQDWKTTVVDSVRIAGGRQIFRVTLEDGRFNLNYIDYELTAPCPVVDISNCVRSEESVENQNIWLGGAKADWFESTCNWSKGHFPTECEDVVIAPGVLLEIQSGEQAECYSLEVLGRIIVHHGASLEVVTRE